MAVHLGEAGHEVLAAAVDAQRALGDWHPGGGTELGDPALTDDHRLALEHPVAVHRHHGDVHEGDDLAGGPAGRA